MKPSRSAFTLVEVMVVITIVVTLATIAIVIVVPTLRASRARADLAQAATVAGNIEAYYQNPTLNTYPLPVTEGTTVPHNTSLDAADVAQIATLDEVLFRIGILDREIQWRSSSHDEARASGLAFSIANQRWEGTGPIVDASSNRPTIESRLSDPSTAPSAAQGANFRLDGTSDLPSNALVYFIKLPALQASAAYALAEAALPEAQLPADNTVACNSGPVAYAAPVNGVTDVYLFVSSR